MMNSISRLGETRPERNGRMERNFPVIPTFRNFRPTSRGTPKISEWNTGKCLFHSLPNPEFHGDVTMSQRWRRVTKASDNCLGWSKWWCKRGVRAGGGEFVMTSWGNPWWRHERVRGDVRSETFQWADVRRGNPLYRLTSWGRGIFRLRMTSWGGGMLRPRTDRQTDMFLFGVLYKESTLTTISNR